MGGKAKPKKHTAAELAAKAKAATESVGGGNAGIAERDKKAKLTTECLEPGCMGIKITSLTVCKTHWSQKHCSCRMTIECCTCFPADKYEPLFQKAAEKVATHHNQAATLSSNKNASKAVRDKLKAQQAAAAIVDDANKKSKQCAATPPEPPVLAAQASSPRSRARPSQPARTARAAPTELTPRSAAADGRFTAKASGPNTL